MNFTEEIIRDRKLIKKIFYNILFIFYHRDIKCYKEKSLIQETHERLKKLHGRDQKEV